MLVDLFNKQLAQEIQDFKYNRGRTMHGCIVGFSVGSRIMGAIVCGGGGVSHN